MDPIANVSTWVASGQWAVKLAVVGAAALGLTWTQIRPFLFDVFGRTESIKKRAETLKVLYEIAALKVAAGLSAESDESKKWARAMKGLEFEVARDLTESGASRIDRTMKVFIAKAVLWAAGFVVPGVIQYLLALAAYHTKPSIVAVLVAAPVPAFIVSRRIFARITSFVERVFFLGDLRFGQELYNQMATAMNCLYLIEALAVGIQSLSLLRIK